ncbi:TLC domain-containing protein 2-like [Watersipora subatra]|uniref:TLC domain-containing protein 2-like n=1 Tax=Watersipora subatra TaxID=2589382 RepID=UPI00355C3BC3
MEEETSYYPISTVTASVLLFSTLGYITSKNIPSRSKSSWKFKNIFVSLLHAATSGTWACYCLLYTPGLAQDVISSHDIYSYSLVCFSLGYTIYDCVDMLLFHRKRDTFELLGHHTVILVAFGIAIAFQTYVGYAVVALVVEVNSVFLHIRQLMLICRIDKSSACFRLNGLANVGSFITFRIMTFAWMTRWLFLNKDLVPLVFFTIGSIGLAVVTLMTIVLFYRLLKSDFKRSTALPTDKSD